ncbi:MAG: 3-dehydroquinate synthase [Candidatus Omnitrophica bacterium]|nr:3-dehydroquinate synthase [Candidatus Omnitrophota bacterium]
MDKVSVNLGDRSYQILIGEGILSRLGIELKRRTIGDTAFVITNNTVQKSHGAVLIKSLTSARLSPHLRLIPDTERSKSLRMADVLLHDIAAVDKTKRIFVVAFGGGVVGDLAGFVASIYKRGIPYVQIPTSLLAQVDSSIGGKTAVDLPSGKNLVGTFYQPCLVVSDVSLLQSLPPRQLKTGLAEVIKYGIIKDAALFNYLEKNQADILAGSTRSLRYIVERCSFLKADIVSGDEKEQKGIRTILNFGHTIGHAIEQATGYNRYSHGEAVSLGMLVATDISRSLGIAPMQTEERIRRIIAGFGLPTAIRHLAIKPIIEAHYRDKKFVGDKNRMVLVRAIGKVIVKENIPFAVIKNAIQKICS